MAELRVDVTQYTVSLFPRDSIDGSVFDVRVEYRGYDRWAILRGAACLSRSGRWEYERLPSSRGEKWLAEHRFERAEALALACRVAPDVRINGRTALEALGGSDGHSTCREFLREQWAGKGIEVHVAAVPPIVAPPYEEAPFTCPHGVTYWVEPTSEQFAQWMKEGTP